MQHHELSGSKDPDRWHRELGREYQKPCRIFEEMKSRRRVQLESQRSVSYQCYLCYPTTEDYAIMIVKDSHLRLVKSKGCFDLVKRNQPGDLGCVPVERSAHVLIIAENKCPFEIEAAGDDIPSILSRKFYGLLWL